MPPVVAQSTRARNNPFATVRLEALEYKFEHDTWTSFLARLESMNYRGALVGPEGVGKTTLLFEMRKRLAEDGFNPLLIRLSGGKRNLPLSFWLSSLKEHRIILVDSAENLPTWQFQLLKLKCKLHSLGLCVTAHKEGLLPTLIQCRTSLDLLDQLSEKLLGYKLEKQSLAKTYKSCDGNLRLAFLKLYTDI
ncbi:hypothetical protein KA183_11315 [bacterium]|nr:hypothetical protein [bacterium]